MNEQVHYIEIEGIHQIPLLLEDLINSNIISNQYHILFKQHTKAIVVHQNSMPHEKMMRITLVAQDYTNIIYATAFTQAAKISLNVVAEGIGSSISVRGAYCARSDAAVSVETKQMHKHPHGKSSVLFKGLLAGKANSIYKGTICIKESALETRADQSHYAMLLSPHARSLSVPSLEILTDNVQCKHGSATGPLGERELLYAMSRGLSKKEAHILLIKGFFADVFNASSQLQTFYHHWIDETIRDYYEST